MKQIPNWIKNAYKGTSVHWSKTQTQVIKMLGELGVEQIRFTSLPDSMIMEFVVTIDEDSGNRAVRIITPLSSAPGDFKQRENEMNTIQRVMLNHMKAKFIAIGKGITEFDTEFMAHLIVRFPDGSDSTMGQTMLPQYRKNLSGKGGEFNLLGDGK